jgi:hypothetical protein
VRAIALGFNFEAFTGITTMDYQKFLTDRIKLYLDDQADGKPIPPLLPFLELDWAKDNSDYFAKLVKHKIISAKDVARQTASAEQSHAIGEKLGEVPQCVRDYARIYSNHIQAEITFKGAIKIAGIQSPTILDYSRGARLTADELGLPFSRPAINDAVEEFYVLQREKALDAVKAAIEPRSEFDWVDLAETCFDLSGMSADFVVAVLQKTVWQVKRKLWRLPVSHHLMPVLFGSQGSGKSWFLSALAQPIYDLSTWSDFEAIGDERNIDLWRTSLLIMDEMAKAAKSDIETTKHVISADTLERRPMRTNSTVTVRQCATLIGSSNMSLVELIRDETGNRRFVQLSWVGAEHSFVNNLNFTDAWRSVHHQDPDPMLPFMEELRALQSAHRNYGPVESWLIQLDERAWNDLHASAQDGFITTSALFQHYLNHRQLVNGGSEREHRSMSTFSAELARVCTQTDFGIEKKRTSRANGYHLTRPAARRADSAGLEGR